MVQILLNRLKGRSHFSFKRSLQVKGTKGYLSGDCWSMHRTRSGMMRTKFIMFTGLYLYCCISTSWMFVRGKNTLLCYLLWSWTFVESLINQHGMCDLIEILPCINLNVCFFVTSMFFSFDRCRFTAWWTIAGLSKQNSVSSTNFSMLIWFHSFWRWMDGLPISFAG